MLASLTPTRAHARQAERFPICFASMMQMGQTVRVKKSRPSLARASSFADLAQNFRRVFAEPRRGAFRRHGFPADDDRCAYARDRTGLGRRARRLDPHPAMDDRRVGENLVEGIDRPGWNPYRLELG